MSTQFRSSTVKGTLNIAYSLLMQAVMDTFKEETDVKYPQVSEAVKIAAQVYALGYVDGCVTTARNNGSENVDPLEAYAYKYEDLLKSFTEMKKEEEEQDESGD